MGRAPRAGRRAIAVALTVTALALVACSSGKKNSDNASSSSGTDEATTTTAPPVAPLTGLPLSDASIATRAAVMFKIPDDPHARPQSGLDKADVIYEERVEGNTVRLLAVFQSQDASSVGPIRSVRSTDAGIIAPIGGVFVFSGGIEPFKALVKQQGVTVMIEDENSPGFTLRPDRERPYKTYASTSTMRGHAKNASAPPSLFAFLKKGDPFSAAGASPATGATVAWGPGSVTGWTWDQAAGTWKRSDNGAPHRVEGGTQLAFTNVILMTVPYRATPYRDRANSGVDEAVTVGTGDAVLLTNGQQIHLRWSKPTLKSVTAFTTADGQALKLPAGQTWIALVPTGTAVNVTAPAAAASSTTR